MAGLCPSCRLSRVKSSSAGGSLQLRPLKWIPCRAALLWQGKFDLAFKGLRMRFSLAAPPAQASSLSPTLVTLSSAPFLSCAAFAQLLALQTPFLSSLLSQLSFHSLGRMRGPRPLLSAQLAHPDPPLVPSQTSHFSCQSSDEVDPEQVLIFLLFLHFPQFLSDSISYSVISFHCSLCCI